MEYAAKPVINIVYTVPITVLDTVIIIDVYIIGLLKTTLKLLKVGLIGKIVIILMIAALALVKEYAVTYKKG
jgi:hypothetical protein